jgi:hypothetical protein
MSGIVSERLVQLLPRVLAFEDKYELIQKLWQKYQRKARLRVEVDPTKDPDAAVASVVSAAVALDQSEIPAAVLSRLDWLTNKEGQAARVLLAQVAKWKGQVLAEALADQVRAVLEIVRTTPNRTTAIHVAELPFATVDVVIRSSTSSPNGRHSVSNPNPNSSNTTPPGALVPVPAADNKPAPIAKVENPKDILSEALKHLTTTQTEKVVGKAAEELVRLGTLEKEGQIESGQLREKLEGVSSAVQDHAATQNGRATGEIHHRGTSGTVTVKFESGQPAPAPKASSTGCLLLIATVGLLSAISASALFAR